MNLYRRNILWTRTRPARELPFGQARNHGNVNYTAPACSHALRRSKQATKKPRHRSRRGQQRMHMAASSSERPTCGRPRRGHAWKCQQRRDRRLLEAARSSTRGSRAWRPAGRPLPGCAELPRAAARRALRRHRSRAGALPRGDQGGHSKPAATPAGRWTAATAGRP